MAVSIIGPKFYAWDSDTGKPLAFGKVYTYAAGTNTPKATWQSEDGTVANTNPVILNGAGYADIYLRGRYKIVVKDADDVEVWTADPVSDASSLLQPWIEETAATQVAPNQFKVTGNKTDVFRYGRSVKLDDQVIVYGTVLKSEYLSGETFVTIDAVDSLTSQLNRAWASLVDLESLLPVLKDEAGTTLVNAVTESLATFQPRMEQRFNLLLAASGYEFLATYQQGIEVTEYNQVLRDAAGEMWRAAATTTLPYTTTGAGMPEGGAFVAVGDAVLRQELAGDPAAGLGVAMIRGAVAKLPTVAALKQYPTGEGSRVVVLEAGKYGAFTWAIGDYSDLVSLDIPGGVAVASEEDPEGLTGVWLREGYKDDGVKPEMFGAVGDGATDDTAAFESMTSVINELKIEKLSLRGGAVYRIGRQTFTGVADGAAYGAVTMLTLRDLPKFKLEGNGATIKLNDGLRYGSFDPVTGEVYTPGSMPFTDSNYAATIGWILRFNDSKNIELKNFTVDGNANNLVIGGQWGDTGIQRRAVGIAMYGVSKVKMSGVHSVNNGLDGLYLRGESSGSLLPSKLDGIHVKDCVFDLNGRQGCSITGGSGITFENTVFSNTSKGAVSSAPASGLDLEPNSGYYCSSITLKGCLFENNGSTELISDSGGPRTRGLVVDNCEFWAFTSDPLWLRVKGALIRNCKIHGGMTNISRSVRFEDCSIDNDEHPVHGRAGRRGALLENGGGVWVRCEFRSYNDLRVVLISNPSEFYSCKFIYGGEIDGRTDHDFVGLLNAGQFYRCEFSDEIESGNTHLYYWSVASASFYQDCEVLGPFARWGSWSPAGSRTGRLGYIPNSSGGTDRSIRLYTQKNTDFLTVATRDAMPTTGSWVRGDRVLNSAPSAGGFEGWVCVSGGSPGTWKGYGAIEA